MGQLRWSIHGGGIGARLLGRSEIVSRAAHVNSSYSCTGCCPSSFAWAGMNPFSVLVLVNGFAPITAQETDGDCYGNFITFSAGGAEWSCSNTSIATVEYATGGENEVEGLAPGTVTVSVWWPYEAYIYDGQDCRDYGASTAATSSDVTVDTLRALVPNPPVTEVDGSPGIIARQLFSVVLQAIDAQGNVDPANSATVTISSSRTLDSTETGLPSSVTLSSGQYTSSVVLNRVNGTERGTTFRFTPSGGGQLDLLIYTYFGVTASLEGLVGHTTACGHVITSNDHFVALPSTGLCNRAVVVRNAAFPLQVDSTTVRDVGPWFPNTPGPGNSNPCSGGNDAYWNTGGVPRVLSTTCDSNNAAIDLAPGTASTVSISGLGSVLWRFN